MNGNEHVGILIAGNPGLDTYMIPIISSYIKDTARRMAKTGQPVNQSTLADALGISRNRTVRTIKALGITHVYDANRITQ